jgi:hypothetical protein
MRGPEEWPSNRSNPADKIRLTGPAAKCFELGAILFIITMRQHDIPDYSFSLTDVESTLEPA